MKRSALGGIITVLLLVSAVLVLYIFASRTTSGFRLKQFHETAGFLEGHIDTLETQRKLLRDSAASLEKELTILNKRIVQVGVEIDSMKGLVQGVQGTSRDRVFHWNRFRFTTASGVLIIAFLVFIWLLYTTVLKSESPGEETPLPVEDSPGEDSLPPGSVLEEEYPVPSEEAVEDKDEAGGAADTSPEPPVAEKAEEPPPSEESGDSAGEEKDRSD